MTTLTYELETITPDTALEYLKRNKSNRNLNDNDVDKWGRAMTAGTWTPANLIAFDNTGSLIDGQHRLTACVRFETSFTAVVMRGVAPTAQLFIDTGRKRSFSDALKLKGYTTNLTAVGGIVRMHRVYLRTGDVSDVGVSTTATIHELMEQFEANADLYQRAAAIGRSVANRSGMATDSILGTAYMIMASIDIDDADAFMDLLATGSGLAEGDPIFALRHWLGRDARASQNKQSTRGVGASSSAVRRQMLGTIIKAWNKYRKGETATRIMMVVGGAKRESFPEPI